MVRVLLHQDRNTDLYPVSLLVADRKKVRTTNRALIVVLVLELFSRNLRRVPPPSSSLERSEHARRDKDMLWYLLRGSIWQGYTRQASLAASPAVC